MKLKFILKKKVLFVIDTLEVGGAERSTLEIASRLKTWHPVICQLYNGGALLSDYTFSDSQIIGLGLNGPYQWSIAIRKFLTILEQTKPDLVVATLLRSELVARYCCRKKGIPIIGTFVNDTYSPYELRNVKFSLKWKIRLFQILNMLTARWCVLFISNSNAIKHSNARTLCIPRSKIEVIPRGRKVPSQLPSRQCFKTDRPVFCSVGRLIRRKGQLELLKAFQLLLSDFPGATLRIAGEGNFRGELQRHIKEFDLQQRIQLVGTERNIDEFYSNADIAVFASHYEGFSGAVLEAALAGIPMILSDIPMNREVVPSDGALFFEVSNVQSLYKSMLEMLASPELALLRSKQAFEFASSHLNIDHVVGKHELVYDMALAASK